MRNIIGSGGGGGGKGGGGSRGRAPVEAPNTLRSRAVARVLDLICEGEIEGLVAGAKSIKFDDTQLQNDDGTYNFNNVEWAERVGTPNQDIIPGFSEVKSTKIVANEITNAATRLVYFDNVLNGTPVVKQISGTITSVTVEIRFPYGLSAPGTAQSPGTRSAYYQTKVATSVEFAIDVQANGGGYTTVVQQTITDLTQNIIEKSYTFNLSGSAPWDIRLRRITANTPDTTFDLMQLVAISYTDQERVVRTITNEDLTRVAVILRLPNGLFEQATTTGDINPSSVEIAIDLQQDGGVYVQQIRDVIYGKTTTPYERSYNVYLPAGTGPWNIGVRRITSSNQGINITNAVSWASYVEILDHKLIYPDSALVGIAIDAEAFGGNVPTRSYHIKGRIINIPSNYDPITREYTGVWDGTFQLAWSDNPAWCFYDMVTHTRYGLGEFVDAGGLKWDLYQIGQYCDEMIPDGNGGFEPRFTFNGGFQTADEAYRVIQAMASVFRGMAWWSSGGIAASCDMPSDAVKLVSPANVINGDIHISGSALKARHTVAFVQWNDPDDGYRLNIEVVEDQEAIIRYGWRPIEVTAIACTSQGQAARVGKWILDSEKNENQAIVYQASWDHADIEPGVIINVSDPAFSGVRRAGRIAEVTDDAGSPLLYTGVVIDDPVELQSDITYTLHYVLPDQTLGSAELSNSPGTTDILTFSTPISIAPLVNAMWTLTGSDVEPKPFRVIGVNENENHIFEIAGIFHDVTKYDRIEQNLKIEPPQYTTIQAGPILAPSNIKTLEYLYLAGGVGARSALTISWQAPEDARVQYYQLQYKTASIEWRDLATVSSISYDWLDSGTGTYDFRVRSVDALGRTSVWVALTNVYLSGLYVAPGNVSNFKISVLNEIATLTWLPVSALNLSHYEIRFSPSLSASWQTSVLLLNNITTTSVQVPAMQGSYLIKAVTIQEIYSVSESIIVNTVINFEELSSFGDVAEQPNFTGTKEDVVINSVYDGLMLGYASDYFDPDDFFEYTDFFLLDGGFSAEGTYTGNFVDLGEELTVRLRGTIEAFGLNVSADFFSPADYFDPDDYFRVSTDQWGISLQVRTTTDDPNSSPVDWSEWGEFIIGDYTIRSYQPRLILSASEFGVTPVVTRMEVDASAPHRTIAEDDVIVPVTGKRIDFLPPYRAFNGVTISAQGLATGDYYQITNKDRFGFDIIFRNSGGSAVERTIDYNADGHGAIQ